MVAGAMGVGLSSSSSIAACEEEETPPPLRTAAQQQQEMDEKYTIEPDDPYYNIPEEDEPTDCSMCLTFRQGPCRVDWKRFELCVKEKSPPKKEEGDDGSNNGSLEEQDDLPKKEEDPTACMKYAMPFYLCSSNHVNSYLLIGNDQTQKTVIEPMMETFHAEEAQSRRLCYSKDALELDWVHWETFVSKLHELGGHVPTKFALEKTGFKSAVEALKATWADNKENGENNQYLMMDEQGEPYLLTVFAQIPKDQPGNNGAKLFMTFALDQHGNLLGDARNQQDEESEEKKEEENEEKDLRDTHVRLQVQVLPGVTEKFTIYGLYVPKEGDFLEEGILFESKSYTFDKANEKAIQKANEKLVLLAKQKSQDQKKEEEDAE